MDKQISPWDKISKANPPEHVRAYGYRVLVAVGALVALYGLATAEEIAAWLGLAAVALNVLPAANTTTRH